MPVDVLDMLPWSIIYYGQSKYPGDDLTKVFPKVFLR